MVTSNRHMIRARCLVVSILEKLESGRKWVREFRSLFTIYSLIRVLPLETMGSKYFLSFSDSAENLNSREPWAMILALT